MMTRMWFLAIGAAALAACGGGGGDGSTDSSDAAGASWSMFKGAPQHGGQAAVNGPHAATLQWKYQYVTSGNNGTAPKNFAVDSSGRVYCNAGHALLAFDPNGTVRWSASLAGAGSTALSADEGTVYASGNGTLYAYTASGEKLWSLSLSSFMLHGEIVVASDGTLYCGSWDTYVYAVKSDGTLKWKYATDGSIAPLASPTLSNDEKTVYVGSGDPNHDSGGTLYALGNDGTLKWKKTISGNRASGAVVGSDGRIYAGGAGSVHCFAADGTKLWSSTDGTASSLCPGLSKQGMIYVGTGPDGKVYALDASTGATLWSYQTGINPDYDPNNPKDPPYGVLTAPLIGADGVVYMGAMDGKLYALNPDGTLLWSYATGNNIDENGPAIGPDGTLYFSSADGYIYAVKD